MKKIVITAKISILAVLSLCIQPIALADTTSTWGVKPNFEETFQKLATSSAIAQIFSIDTTNHTWTVKTIYSVSTPLKNLNKSLDPITMFDEKSSCQACREFYQKWFTTDSQGKITWKISNELATFKNQLNQLTTDLIALAKSSQGLTPQQLLTPCCTSDECQQLFKQWVKVDKKTVTIENLNATNINDALSDVSKFLSTIETQAFLLADDETNQTSRGFSSDTNNVKRNLANLELRLAALEGNYQTFCCTDEECKNNCPNGITLAGTSCSINPECASHPSGMVSLKTDDLTRAQNILKRTIALIPKTNIETIPSDAPDANICIMCSTKTQNQGKTESAEIIDTNYYFIADTDNNDNATDAEKAFTFITNIQETLSDLKDNPNMITALPDTSDELQRLPIHYVVEACTQNNVDLLTYLITNGASEQVNAQREDGKTPLHIIAELAQKQNCNPDIIKKMIKLLRDESLGDNKADITIKNYIDATTSPNAGTPIDVAQFTSYYSGDTTAEEALTGQKNQFKKDNPFMPMKPSGVIPKKFFEAAITGNLPAFTEQFNILGNNPALINMQDPIDTWHRTALHYAASGCTKGHADIVDMLLKNGATVNTLSSINDTPLHLASESALFAYYAHDDQATCQEGFTARIIQALLAHGANAKAQNKDGRRPLDVATLAAFTVENNEAILALTNHMLMPCTQLEDEIKKGSSANITVDRIGECLNAYIALQGTHVYFDANHEAHYYCVYNASEPSDAQKLYFIETKASELEGTSGNISMVFGPGQDPTNVTQQRIFNCASLLVKAIADHTAMMQIANELPNDSGTKTT